MSDQVLVQLPSFTAYVESGRAPRWTMGLADIHGFLTALSMVGPWPDADWMSWIWSGETPEFSSEDEQWNVMAELIAFHSGQKIEQIQQDSERDRWFTPDQAKEYGLVDKVIVKRGEIR